MDANGTRYKLLLGHADWARCTLDGKTRLADRWASHPPPLDGAAWDSERHELTLQDVPSTLPARPGERYLDLRTRRGAAMDRFRNWYWIDDAGNGIRVLSSGSGTTGMFWPVDEPAAQASTTVAGFGAAEPPRAICARPLRGLAVTDDHYLVAGSLDPAGLLVFDLKTGGPPWQMTWPASVPFAPFDIAARPDGGVFVLTADADGGRRVWRLDRHLMVESLAGPEAAPDHGPSPAPTFEPVDGTAREDPDPPGRRMRLHDAAALEGDPIAIDVAGDDRVVVLDRRNGSRTSRMRLYSSSMTDCSVHSLGGPGVARPFVAHDIAVLRAGPTAPHPRLFVVDRVGDQAYRFDLTPDGPRRARGEFLPMRLFGGRGLVGTHLGVWYDLGDRWIPLVAQPRPRYVDRTVVVTPVFDSREPGCVWHRVLLDGCIGPDAEVTIRSAASDDRAALDPPMSWRREPVPYRRGDGPERPYADRDADPRYGTWELLLQEARGRYLRLELALKGNGQTTPRIRALRAYFPRFSYLEHYLPAVYREEPGSARFLDGFLANLEGFYTAIEDRIASVEVLLDPRTAPREALDWLASWFEVVLDPGWDEARRRLFLRYAVELFRWRGTERGMRLALGLALLHCPDASLFSDATEPGGIRIVERYQTKRAPAALFGDPIAQALPRETSAGPRWTPRDGGEELNTRYREYLGRLVDRGLLGGPLGNVRFPLVAPRGERSRAWAAFSVAVLGFVPSAASSPEMGARWSTFLARRYIELDALNRAYQRIGGTALAAFDDAEPPGSLPADGAPLTDWYAFESVVVPSVRAAHRFSVMLPVPVGRATRGGVVRPSDARDRMADQERVRRLVELEKPAHTVFDVKSFWLGFRVGEARLGKDTLLDYGSRSPDLRPPAVLGSMHVGGSVLTSRTAEIPDRPAVFSGSIDAASRRVVRRTDG